MTTQQAKQAEIINAGDEVTRIDWERSYLREGEVLKLVPGGYEVLWYGTKSITYENHDTIELRYPAE